MINYIRILVFFASFGHIFLSNWALGANYQDASVKKIQFINPRALNPGTFHVRCTLSDSNSSCRCTIAVGSHTQSTEFSIPRDGSPILENSDGDPASIVCSDASGQTVPSKAMVLSLINLRAIPSASNIISIDFGDNTYCGKKRFPKCADDLRLEAQEMAEHKSTENHTNIARQEQGVNAKAQATVRSLQNSVGNAQVSSGRQNSLGGVQATVNSGRGVRGTN